MQSFILPAYHVSVNRYSPAPSLLLFTRHVYPSPPFLLPSLPTLAASVAASDFLAFPSLPLRACWASRWGWPALRGLSTV